MYGWMELVHCRRNHIVIESNRSSSTHYLNTSHRRHRPAISLYSFPLSLPAFHSSSFSMANLPCACTIQIANNRISSRLHFRIAASDRNLILLQHRSCRSDKQKVRPVHSPIPQQQRSITTASHALEGGCSSETFNGQTDRATDLIAITWTSISLIAVIILLNWTHLRLLLDGKSLSGFRLVTRSFASAGTTNPSGRSSNIFRFWSI